MDGDHDRVEDGGAEASADADERAVLERAPSALRLLALALVVVGFVGAVSNDASPVAADTAFSLLFYAGIGCAVGSVYLGLYAAGSE